MVQKSLTDSCIVLSDLLSEVLDIGMKQRPNCQLNSKSHWSNVAYKIKWKALADRDVRKQFASSIATKFRQLPEISQDIELECLLFQTAMISSAVESCGPKWLIATAGSKKRTPWWNQEVKEAIRAKKDALRRCCRTALLICNFGILRHKSCCSDSRNVQRTLLGGV